MKVVSGLDKIKKMGGKVDCMGGMGFKVDITTTNTINPLKVAQDVHCSKCNTKMPFVMALFDVNTDKVYCPSCCGFSINSKGDTVSNEESDLLVDFESVEDLEEVVEMSNIKLSKQEIKSLSLLLETTIPSLISSVMDKEISDKKKSKYNMEILMLAGILMKIEDDLGDSFPEDLRIALMLLQKLEGINNKTATLLRRVKVEKKKCDCDMCKDKANKKGDIH